MKERGGKIAGRAIPDIQAKTLRAAGSKTSTRARLSRPMN
jgi:hypothetical protein